jgi:predicted nucleic acid-binding protein
MANRAIPDTTDAGGVRLWPGGLAATKIARSCGEMRRG